MPTPTTAKTSPECSPGALWRRPEWKAGVATDMIVTGRPARFGRGLIEDVGGKIISQFADCLSARLGQTDTW